MENLLENNSEEMKTQVQTYLIEETQELIYDNEKLEQWGDLVKSLGLKGQSQIQQPEKSPIPFMVMNQTTESIIKTLCPRNVEITEYNLTPIPVELLDLVALSIKEGYFSKIEVWYDDQKKDPAIVGSVGSWSEYSWYNDSNKSLEGKKFKTKKEGVDAGGNHINFSINARYLLGRWADIKEDFNQLAKRAKDRFILAQQNDQEKIILDAQRKIEDLKSDAFDKFGV